MKYRTVVIEAKPDSNLITQHLNEHGPHERLHSITAYDGSQHGTSTYIIVFEEYILVPVRLQDMMNFTQHILDDEDRKPS